MTNILSVKEAANFIRVSTSTIYTMVRLDEIPHFRARGKILFNQEVLEAFTRSESKQVVS
ncbi:helix-turn-helix domain-containing protein [Psychrobacillus sp. MER TA 171]|uniref:helix-turn-helix domain-containing protein n=1 Tax=Psychrobacillus sp. MER TA 171 TaxID=2939577 RepID=UPI0020423C34|nr:helix-turn-helix domain-containing protein [Psychrobacillus sp. MER TA 171]MCM3359365.1 helix-turn-helix domain-containing protein [Psychrobacillus sp. MER TA 171]